MPNVATKDSQAKNLEAVQQILAKRQAIGAAIAPQKQETEKAQNLRILETNFPNPPAQELTELDALCHACRDLCSRECPRLKEDDPYEIDRVCKPDMDNYTITTRQIRRKLAETSQARKKQWAARQRLLDANQSLLEEHQRQTNALPLELDGALKQARTDGSYEANQAAKTTVGLLETKRKFTKQGFNLQIQFLAA